MPTILALYVGYYWLRYVSHVTLAMGNSAHNTRIRMDNIFSTHYNHTKNLAYFRTGKRVQVIGRADHGYDLWWIRDGMTVIAVNGSQLVSSTAIIRFYRALTLGMIVILATTI